MEADFCILLQQLGLEEMLFDNTFKLFPIKSFYFKHLCLIWFFWLLCDFCFGGVGRMLGFLVFFGGFGCCFEVFWVFGGFFAWVCWGFFLLYFKRGMARDKGNLSKLFKCCLVNDTLSPLSAVLAGIHMCSHKSSPD